MVTFTEETLNGKLHFLCSGCQTKQQQQQQKKKTIRKWKFAGVTKVDTESLSMMFVSVLLFCGFITFSKCKLDTKECENDKTMINGCSVPWGIDFPYKEFFLPACNRHDVCYSCVSS